MTETITLKDGTVFDKSNAISDDNGNLFVYTRNQYTMKDVFDALYNPERTETIIYTQVNGETVTFSGYDRLVSVRDEGRGTVTAVLKK